MMWDGYKILILRLMKIRLRGVRFFFLLWIVSDDGQQTFHDKIRNCMSNMDQHFRGLVKQTV